MVVGGDREKIKKNEKGHRELGKQRENKKKEKEDRDNRLREIQRK